MCVTNTQEGCTHARWDVSDASNTIKAVRTLWRVGHRRHHWYNGTVRRIPLKTADVLHCTVATSCKLDVFVSVCDVGWAARVGSIKAAIISRTREEIF